MHRSSSLTGPSPHLYRVHSSPQRVAFVRDLDVAVALLAETYLEEQLVPRNVDVVRLEQFLSNAIWQVARHADRKATPQILGPLPTQYLVLCCVWSTVPRGI